jgi:TPP-dependent 2-oxoacid decarboxylase
LRNVESFEIPGAAEGESVVLSCNKDATHAYDITMNFAGNTVPLKINVSHEGEFSSPTFNYLKSELEHILQFEFTDSLPEDGTTVLIAGLIQSSETLNQEVKDRALAILAELGIKTAEMVKGKYQISGTSDKFNGIYAMLDAKLESVEQGDLPPNPATNPSFN